MYICKIYCFWNRKINYCGFKAIRRICVCIIQDIRKKTMSFFSLFLFFFNCRLQDLFQQEKGRKRPSVPPSPGRLRQGEESKVMLFSLGVFIVINTIISLVTLRSGNWIHTFLIILVFLILKLSGFLVWPGLIFFLIFAWNKIHYNSFIWNTYQKLLSTGITEDSITEAIGAVKEKVWMPWMCNTVIFYCEFWVCFISVLKWEDFLKRMYQVSSMWWFN